MSFNVKCVTSCVVGSTLMIKKYLRTLLTVQWLGFHTSNTGGVGSVPGLGAEIPSAVCREQTHTHRYIRMCVRGRQIPSVVSIALQLCAL